MVVQQKTGRPVQFELLAMILRMLVSYLTVVCMALGRIALRRTDRLQRIFVASDEVLDPRGTKLSARRWRQRRCPISVVRTPMPAGRVLRRPILARHHARSGASALPASLSEAVEQPHIIHFPHPRDPLLMEPCRRSHGSEVVHDILSLGDVVTPGQRCPQPTIAYALVGILLHRVWACADAPA
jgi:hypothetical protein